MADNDRVRSEVWMFFQKIPEKMNKLICKICSKEIAYYLHYQNTFYSKRSRNYIRFFARYK